MRHENENVQYLWIKPPDAPENLPIYCLVPGSFQDTASKVSCLQEIAGDRQIFSLTYTHLACGLHICLNTAVSL